MPVWVNPDGNAQTDNSLAVTALNWEAGNALSVGGTTAAAIAASMGPDSAFGFDTHFQTRLASFTDARGNQVAVPEGVEWTLVATFTEKVVAVGEMGIQLGLSDAADAKHSLTIYVDDTPDANHLEGTGFDDGVAVFTGDITAVNDFFAIIGGPNPADPSSLYDFRLDQSGPDDHGMQLSLAGIGQSQISYMATGTHSDYLVVPDHATLITSGTFTSQISMPFDQVDPAKLFSDGQGGTITPTLGPVNGAQLTDSLTDIQFQIAGQQTLGVQFAPQGPDFWKSSKGAWPGYKAADRYRDVFGVAVSSSITLSNALNGNNRGAGGLLRASVAGLFNAEHPDVYYLYSSQEVVRLVQHAFRTGEYDRTADLLSRQNEVRSAPIQELGGVVDDGLND